MPPEPQYVTIDQLITLLKEAHEQRADDLKQQSAQLREELAQVYRRINDIQKELTRKIDDGNAAIMARIEVYQKEVATLLVQCAARGERQAQQERELTANRALLAELTRQIEESCERLEERIECSQKETAALKSRVDKFGGVAIGISLVVSMLVPVVISIIQWLRGPR